MRTRTKPGEIRFVDEPVNSTVFRRMHATSSTRCFMYDTQVNVTAGAYVVLANDSKLQAENGVGRPAYVLMVSRDTYCTGWTWDSVLPRK